MNEYISVNPVKSFVSEYRMDSKYSQSSIGHHLAKYGEENKSAIFLRLLKAAQNKSEVIELLYNSCAEVIEKIQFLDELVILLNSMQAIDFLPNSKLKTALEEIENLKEKWYSKKKLESFLSGKEIESPYYASVLEDLIMNQMDILLAEAFAESYSSYRIKAPFESRFDPLYKNHIDLVNAKITDVLTKEIRKIHLEITRKKNQFLIISEAKHASEVLEKNIIQFKALIQNCVDACDSYNADKRESEDEEYFYKNPIESSRIWILDFLEKEIKCIIDDFRNSMPQMKEEAELVKNPEISWNSKPVNLVELVKALIQTNLIKAPSEDAAFEAFFKFFGVEYSERIKRDHLTNIKGRQKPETFITNSLYPSIKLWIGNLEAAVKARKKK